MRNQYTASEFIENVFAFIDTKIFYPGARLIRRPVYIRGKKSLRYGKNLTLGHGCRFDLLNKNKVTLFIGNNCEIGDYVHIVATDKVEIGNNVLMASKIFISDTNHGSYKGEEQDSPDVVPNRRKLTTAPVKIGNNVWIGENAVILAGVEIGDGCIIGANSVVNKNFIKGSIIAGCPAEVIKKWDDDNKTWISIK
ncbi:DapH/DapD/GlmU-related protein [Bilifractor sp. LCP21S3_A7]|uniref:DapH/DapD/GlmU-related protein n=1 Tax=Bilifractor sp. LCP21S3_A7 TaxID=3438738 RepID=UPI003F8FB40C